jgi:hypothetical protein
MPTLFYAEERLTRKYVDSCCNLDDWKEHPGMFKELGKALMIPPVNPEEMSDGGTRLMWVVAPPGIDDELAQKIIRDRYQHQGCLCEHDCCGCQSLRVSSIQKTKRKRRYKVYVRISYNF